MTTDLSSASIPSLYREIYDKCSTNGEPIHRDVYYNLLQQCSLNPNQLKAIWDLVGPNQGKVTRTNFYKSLALIAWAQHGKDISEKLFDNFTGDEYPTPKISDLTPVESLKKQMNAKQETPTGPCYATLIQTDTVSVKLVPEKKGLFLKYSEYLVSSKRFSSKVTRRYNDFVALQELLLNRFPYRLVPNLPPKKVLISDSHFLEERTRGLHRWLTLICRHPVICHDALIGFFLTDQGSDLQHRIREIFRRAPDEFTTSDIAASAKDLLPPDQGQIAANRENIRSLVNIVGRMKLLAESSADRHSNAGKDMEEFSLQLKNISSLNSPDSKQSSCGWGHLQQSFGGFSKYLQSVSLKERHYADLEQVNVCEKLSLLLDILVAHKDLCERLEKGLAHDHQVALSKMLSLKKKKLQGVIRGTDAETVEQLEGKMLAQESIISNIDLRTDFSLYCVHIETQLVQVYLGTLPSIVESLIDLKTKSHSELFDLWKHLQSQSHTTADTKGNGAKGTQNLVDWNHFGGANGKNIVSELFKDQSRQRLVAMEIKGMSKLYVTELWFGMKKAKNNYSAC